MSYADIIAQEQASRNKQNQIAGNVEAGSAVQVAGSGLTVDELMGQLGLNQAGVDLGVANSQLQGQYAEANAGIGEEQLGLQAQGLAAQGQLLGTQYGIQQATLGGQEKLAGQQNVLANQGFGAQIGQENFRYGQQVEQTQGSLAAQGALNTEGSKNQQAANLQGHEYTLGNIGRAQEGTADQYAYQKQQFGLEQQGQAAQQQYSLGNIARGQTGLQLASQQNGLSMDQTINQINYGMQQQGLAGQQNADQLVGQIGQAIGQGATYQAGAIGSAALASGSINLNRALSGGQ